MTVLLQLLVSSHCKRIQFHGIFLEWDRNSYRRKQSTTKLHYPAIWDVWAFKHILVCTAHCRHGEPVLSSLVQFHCCCRRQGAQNIGLQGHICQHTPLIATLPETKIKHLTSSLSDFPLHKKGNGIKCLFQNNEKSSTPMFMQNKKWLLWQNGKHSGEKELSFCKFTADYDNT